MNFETIAIRGAYNPSENNHCVNTPIYNTTAYNYDTLEQAKNLYDLKEAGHIYTRLSNPTTSVLEERLALLDGGTGALCTSSGQSATLLAVLNLVKTGDEILCSKSVYGGTYNLFNVTLKKLGIKTVFFNDVEEAQSLISDKTKCVFSELLGNPKLNVEDVENLAAAAHKHNAPLIVDNTVATPYLCRPFEWGADICVYSLTKFYSGHGSVLGGAIVEGGKFNWECSDKFKEFVLPDESYHGLSYVKNFGKKAFTIKAQAQLLRDFGCAISPFNSYMTLQGVETLHLRMQRHSENAFKIAQFLEKHNGVTFVNYPGLKSSFYYDLAQKYLPKGTSGLIGFGVKGNPAKFMESLKIFTHTANLGDVRSIATFPAGTTHAQLSPEQRAQSSIGEDFIRLSVGIENVNDLIEDLDTAINAALK